MCDTLSQNHINSLLTKTRQHDIIFSTEPDNGHKKSHKKVDLQIEAERLKTFKNAHSVLNPEDLARVGLFYSDNKAKCAYCDIEISFYSFGENPLDDHLRLSPSCPFARAKKGQRTLTTFLRALPADQDVCGNLDICTDSVRFLSKIVHQYEEFNNRLKSFETWPKASKQEPEILAEAGFYYKGDGDKTVCFYCSGPLNNWEDDDDPWEQHALWYPKCKFLLKEKGEEFVEDVHKKLKSGVPNNCNFNLERHQTCEDGENVVDEEKMCVVCCGSRPEVLLVPCGHDWTCLTCVKALEDKKCPICREQIINIRNL